MVGKLFRDPTDSISIQVFRYVLAGTLAYVIDYSMLIVYVEIFGMYYLTAAAIAFLIGAVTSYVLNVAWVFNKRAFKDMRLEFLVFVALGAAGLFLNHWCIKFFTETVKLHYLGSKVIATIAVFTVNFIARKYILFREIGPSPYFHSEER